MNSHFARSALECGGSATALDCRSSVRKHKFAEKESNGKCQELTLRIEKRWQSHRTPKRYAQKLEQS